MKLFQTKEEAETFFNEHTNRPDVSPFGPYQLRDTDGNEWWGVRLKVWST